jgi:23S rRNA pseudouridine2605 synthase
MIRLNKFISDCGISSRRKSEELILQGRVEVNKKVIIDLSFKVDPEKDFVELDGEKITRRKHVYYLLNKPKGVITTSNDEKQRRTVVDLIKSGQGASVPRGKIYPVGRLDYNTTGVLILTNDGEFTNLLTHPGNRVPREYEVKLDKMLTEEDKEKLCKGIYIKGGKGKFIKVFNKSKKDKKLVTVIAIEGRNHFVKDIFYALGYAVLDLNRKSFAGITADIPIGFHRLLTKDEISGVYETYGK